MKFHFVRSECSLLYLTRELIGFIWGGVLLWKVKRLGTLECSKRERIDSVVDGNIKFLTIKSKNVWLFVGNIFDSWQQHSSTLGYHLEWVGIEVHGGTCSGLNRTGAMFFFALFNYSYQVEMLNHFLMTLSFLIWLNVSKISSLTNSLNLLKKTLKFIGWTSNSIRS